MHKESPKSCLVTDPCFISAGVYSHAIHWPVAIGNSIPHYQETASTNQTPPHIAHVAICPSISIATCTFICSLLSVRRCSPNVARPAPATEQWATKTKFLIWKEKNTISNQLWGTHFLSHMTAVPPTLCFFQMPVYCDCWVFCGCGGAASIGRGLPSISHSRHSLASSDFLKRG